jgi:hypothetical protein
LLTNYVVAITLHYTVDKYGFFTVENEADKKIDWEKLNPKFITSLEDDEAELARLEKLSHEDNVDVFMDSDSVSTSLVENCLKSNREMEQRAEVISATANMQEEKNPESQRTMLSLRILMKRLSKWQMKTLADTDVTVL